MISRYEVTLNGVSLASIHPAILITDVQYEPSRYERETYSIAKRYGARVHRIYKERAAVSISFMIRSYPIEERQSVCQDIIRWAKDGGDLRINDRPGQKLICVCDQFPAVESVRGWTQELSITFAAYAIPYWQDVEQTVVTFASSETNHVCEFYVPGNAPEAYLSIDADLLVGSMNRLYIGDESDSSKRMNIEDINLDIPSAANGSVHVDYDANCIQTIRGSYEDMETQEEASFNLMGNRTGLDDVIVKCGQTNRVWCGVQVYNAQTSAYQYINAAFTLKVRGLWE